MIKNFSTLNDFFNDQNKNIENGDLIKTYGYNNVSDGGDGLYKVVSVSAADSADANFQGLKVTCKGYKLELIPENNAVRVEQFGAIGINQNENLTDEQIEIYASTNKDAIQNALVSGVSRIDFKCGMCYYTEENISVPSSTDVYGNGATLIFKPTSTNISTHLFIFDCEPEDNTPSKASIIKDLRIVGAFGSSYLNPISSIRIKCAFGVTISNIHFDGGDYAIYAKKRTLKGYDIIGINIVDCIAENVNNGFGFYTAENVKVKNCRIKISESALMPNGAGVFFNENSKQILVEDVSIDDSPCFAVVCSENEWDENADSRIVFKNLLVDNANFAVGITSNDVPIYFSSAMIVDVNYGFYLEHAKNLEVTNSSILIKSPVDDVEDVAPIASTASSSAKFTHVQFDFPWDFQNIDMYNDYVPSEFSFIDCTIQKTDITGINSNVTSKGFGVIGNKSVIGAQITEIFDACEFRSYIQDFVTNSETGAVIYNFPVELIATSNEGSKLIIKNCRFVNENPCTVPCFRLNDDEKFDNIVVYNCFFENYQYSETEDGNTTYPLFGKLTNNILSTDVSGHNIFAKCNMRSSTPVRNVGTEINETVAYQ